MTNEAPNLFPDGIEVRYLTMAVEVKTKVEAALAERADFETGWITVSKMDCSVNITVEHGVLFVKVEHADYSENTDETASWWEYSEFHGQGKGFVQDRTWTAICELYGDLHTSIINDVKAAQDAADLPTEVRDDPEEV